MFCVAFFLLFVSSKFSPGFALSIFFNDLLSEKINNNRVINYIHKKLDYSFDCFFLRSQFSMNTQNIASALLALYLVCISVEGFSRGSSDRSKCSSRRRILEETLLGFGFFDVSACGLRFDLLSFGVCRRLSRFGRYRFPPSRRSPKRCRS